MCLRLCALPLGRTFIERWDEEMGLGQELLVIRNFSALRSSTAMTVMTPPTGGNTDLSNDNWCFFPFKFTVIICNIFEGPNLHQALYQVFCIFYLSNTMNCKCSYYTCSANEGTEA